MSSCVNIVIEETIDDCDSWFIRLIDMQQSSAVLPNEILHKIFNLADSCNDIRSASVADLQNVIRPVFVQEAEKLFAFHIEGSRRIQSAV